jgi:hypothetical protein
LFCLGVEPHDQIFVLSIHVLALSGVLSDDRTRLLVVKSHGKLHLRTLFTILHACIIYSNISVNCIQNIYTAYASPGSVQQILYYRKQLTPQWRCNHLKGHKLDRRQVHVLELLRTALSYPTSRTFTFLLFCYDFRWLHA